MNSTRLAVLRLVNKYKTKEYSLSALTKIIEDMGYAVIELEGDNEKTVLQNQKFFLFDNGVLKYVALPRGLCEEEKCSTLLAVVSDIYVSGNPLLRKRTSPEAFAKELREVLCDKSGFSHIVRHIFEYVSALVILVTVVCFSVVAIFLENSLQKEVILPDFYKTQEFSVFDNSEKEYIIEETVSAFNTVDISDSFNIEIIENVDKNVSKVLSEETNVNNENTTIYYVTKSGTKYHLEGCSYIKDLSKCTPLKYDELYEYQPCKRCIK